MKITVIGASSGVGLLTVQQALAKGHRVTALSRNTAPIPEHALLTKLNGNSSSVADLKRAITGAQAVVITIGSKDKSVTTLFTDTAQALLTAAAAVNLTAPVLVITGFGIGDSGKYLNLLMAFVVKVVLKKQSADKARLEMLLAQSPLKWEIVRPGILSNGSLTKTYHVLPELHKGMKIGRIARADVADFLLREAENPTLIHHYPALTA